jgi:hypothetical protein
VALVVDVAVAQHGEARDEVVEVVVEVDGALPLAQPSLRDAPRQRRGEDRGGGEAVGHAALEVVVAVDADREVDRGADGTDGVGDLVRQRGAVRVAEDDALGAAGRRRAQALERVGRVVAEAVEEVLGVVDDALAGRRQEGDGLGDHRQVLLARHAHDLLEVQPPGLADDGDHLGEAARERLQALVVGSRDPRGAGHPEGDDAAVSNVSARAGRRARAPSGSTRGSPLRRSPRRARRARGRRGPSPRAVSDMPSPCMPSRRVAS